MDGGIEKNKEVLIKSEGGGGVKNKGIEDQGFMCEGGEKEVRGTRMNWM